MNDADADLGPAAGISSIGLQLPEGESSFNPELMNLAELGQRCAELEVRLDVAEAERWQSRAVLASLTQPVIVTDPFEELVLMSQAAATLFGIVPPGERVPILQVIPDFEFVSEIIETRSLSVRGGKRQVRRRLRAAGGGLREFNISMVCVCDPMDGRPSPWGVITYIEPVVDPAVPASANSSGMSGTVTGLADFLADIRASLGSLRSYATLLLDDGMSDTVSQKLDPAMRHRFVHHIAAQVDQLFQLTDSMTLLSELEAGGRAGQLALFDPVKPLLEAIDLMMPQALSRRLQLVTGPIPPGASRLACLGDATLLRQAFVAALANGIKYTTSGGTVTASVEHLRHDRTLRVTISDTGVGIDPKDLPDVFDKLDRGGPTDRPAGSGVGLPIVKRVVETLHNGKVLIDSVPGEGTTLHIDLPLHQGRSGDTPR